MGDAVHECEPRNFLRPCLLLLLLDGPSHGYDLIHRLAPYGVTDDDPGHVYRALRSLERDRLVRSSWAESHSGPRRRVYRLTMRGRDAMAATVPELEHSAMVINRYLRSYADHVRSGGAHSPGLAGQVAR